MRIDVNKPLNPTKINFGDVNFSKYHFKSAAGGMGGQFTDGYILGLIGIALSLAIVPLGLTTFWQGVVGSASLVGLFFGSLIAGPLADRIGRKWIYSSTMLIFAVVSVLQFFVTDPLQLTFLRIILGIALGADYAAGLSLVSETVPDRSRGKVLSILMVGWVAGFSIAYLVGYVLMNYGGEQAWRWILLSSVPALIIFFMRLGTPESPIWLVNQGRHQEAQKIVHQHLGPHVNLPAKTAPIRKASWLTLFSPRWRKNSLIGASFYTCQVIPYFAISTFMPKIMESFNFQDNYASGIIYNVFLLVGSIIGLLLINKLSRRAFLVGSFYITGILLLMLVVWSNMPLQLTIILFSLFACVLAGAGVLEFAYTPELFPTELRASGVGFVVAASRLGGAGGTFLLPFLMQNYGTAAALGSCVFALLIGGFICHLWAPETKHLSLNSH